MRSPFDEWVANATKNANSYDASEYQITAWEWLLLFALMFAAATVFVAVGLYVAGLAWVFE